MRSNVQRLEDFIDLTLFNAFVKKFWNNPREVPILLYCPEDCGTVDPFEYIDLFKEGSLEPREERAVVLAATLSSRRVLLDEDFRSQVIEKAREGQDLCLKIGAFLFDDGVVLDYKFETLDEIALAFLLPDEFAQSVWDTVSEKVYAELLYGDMQQLVREGKSLAFIVDVVANGVVLEKCYKADQLMKVLVGMRRRRADFSKIPQLDTKLCFFLNYSIAWFSQDGGKINPTGQSSTSLLVETLAAFLSDKNPLSEEEKEWIKALLMDFKTLPKKYNETKNLAEAVATATLLRNSDTLLWLFREVPDFELDQMFAANPQDKRFQDLWGKCSEKEAATFFSLYLLKLPEERWNEDALSHLFAGFEKSVGRSYFTLVCSAEETVVPYKEMLEHLPLWYSDLSPECLPKAFWSNVEEILRGSDDDSACKLLEDLVTTFDDQLFKGEFACVPYPFLEVQWSGVKVDPEHLSQLSTERQRFVLDLLNEYVFTNKPDKYVPFLLSVLRLPTIENLYSKEEISSLVETLKRIPGISNYSDADVLGQRSAEVTLEDIMEEFRETETLSERSLIQLHDLWENWDGDYDDAEIFADIYSELHALALVSNETYADVIQVLEEVDAV